MAAADAPLRLVMLGAPGSGKGTQASVLAEMYRIPAISTGDMLRAAVAAGSALGKRVESVMAAGQLVDDDLMAEVVTERLARDDAQGGFLLDGYPRTASQAETLADILSRMEGELAHVLCLEVPDQVLIERALGRGRVDDVENVVRERLRVYAESTEPLVEHYRDLGVLRTVDGDRPVEVVTEALRSVIEGSVIEGGSDGSVAATGASS